MLVLDPHECSIGDCVPQSLLFAQDLPIVRVPKRNVRPYMVSCEGSPCDPIESLFMTFQKGIFECFQTGTKVKVYMRKE